MKFFQEGLQYFDGMYFMKIKYVLLEGNDSKK